MELGNHHLLVTMQSNYMGEAASAHSFGGSMMALMTDEQEETEGARVRHQGPANFMYYNAPPPLQESANSASLFQVAFQDSSHMAPEQSYDLLIQHGPPVQEQRHEQQAVSIVDHEGKSELHSRTVKPKLHGNITRIYSQPSSLTHETRASATSVDIESSCGKTASDNSDPIKDKIIAHPNYHRLVLAYMKCHKVGAPPDVVRRLDELSKEYANLQPLRTSSSIDADPELDQFMDAYCHLLNQYHDELTRPFKEAMAFLQNVELQINNISKGNQRVSLTADGSSRPADERRSEEEEQEEEEGGSCGEVDYETDAVLDPHAEDKLLRDQLLSKYRGYISTLKHEFMKKKKKGKLPKDARQRLLDWWSEHYKWPYPSETEKASLADSTGLDQKQINNWFINQRKRHWKPSEDMRYVMVNEQDVGLVNPLQVDRHQEFYSS